MNDFIVSVILCLSVIGILATQVGFDMLGDVTHGRLVWPKSK